MLGNSYGVGRTAVVAAEAYGQVGSAVGHLGGFADFCGVVDGTGT